jgi:nucleotide-binding universal stress UspA family protein
MTASRTPDDHRPRGVDGGGKMQRVVIATDGSAGSHLAVEAGLELAKETGAGVVLVVKGD